MFLKIYAITHEGLHIPKVLHLIHTDIDKKTSDTGSILSTSSTNRGKILASPGTSFIQQRCTLLTTPIPLVCGISTNQLQTNTTLQRCRHT
ncbi:hypothetical protein Trydic_g9511 [Trypoxylus dichotomus]